MQRTIGFAIGCAAGVLLLVLLVWLLGGFGALGLDTSGVVALLVGVVLTTFLGVGLMALVFFSDRSDQDEAVYHATDRDNVPPPPSK